MSEDDRAQASVTPRTTESAPAPAPRKNPKSQSRVREWTITIGIAAVMLGIMYGVTVHRAEVQSEAHRIEMQRDAAQPPPQLSPI